MKPMYADCVATQSQSATCTEEKECYKNTQKS